MPAFDKLRSLIENFADSQYINLHTERCLNSRFRAVNCSLCADACPAAEAITIIDGKPELDNELCLHCGLCLHYCPTDAFTRNDSLSDKLVRLVQTLPPGNLDLVCPQHPQPAQGPAAQAVQTQRCLAALSPSVLLILSTQEHEIRLDDSYCVECPLAYVHTAIEKTVARANAWAALLPAESSIRLRSEGGNETSQQDQRPVYSAAISPISRRGLFNSLKRAGEKAATPEKKVEMIRSGRDVPVSERLPQSLPRQHAKIISLLESRAGTGIPLSASSHVDLHIDKTRCTACALCAKFCPTGALEFGATDGSFDLTLQPSLCLGNDCHICVLACPDAAINNLSPTPHDLFDRTSLLAGDLTACWLCQQPIHKGSDLPDTCFACQSKGTLVGENLTTDGLWGKTP